MRAVTFRWLIATPTFLAALALILHLFWIFVWPLETITDVKMEIMDPVVKQGEMVRFNASVCKHVDAASELHYGLIGKDSDHQYFDSGMEFGSNPSGCFNVVQHFHIPPDIPPGEYEAVVIGVMKVNALRTDTYRMPMGDLTILEK